MLLSLSPAPAAPTVGLILPCYNPLAGWATTITASLERLQALLPTTALHIYLVNDGSTQGVTEADIAQLRATVPHFTYLTYAENHGKGYALRLGITQAQEPICLFTDVDFPYQERSIAALYETLRQEQCDIAVGVRDEAYYAHVPPARRRVSRLLRGLTRNLLRLPVSDTQCGLKGFNSVGRAMFLQTTIDRYLFDLELLFLAARQPQVRVRPVTVSLKPGVVFSILSLRILLTEGRSFLRILWRGLALPTT